MHQWRNLSLNMTFTYALCIYYITQLIQYFSWVCKLTVNNYVRSCMKFTTGDIMSTLKWCGIFECFIFYIFVLGMLNLYLLEQRQRSREAKSLSPRQATGQRVPETHPGRTATDHRATWHCRPHHSPLVRWKEPLLEIWVKPQCFHGAWSNAQSGDYNWLHYVSVCACVCCMCTVGECV